MSLWGKPKKTLYKWKQRQKKHQNSLSFGALRKWALKRSRELFLAAAVLTALYPIIKDGLGIVFAITSPAYKVILAADPNDMSDLVNLKNCIVLDSNVMTLAGGCTEGYFLSKKSLTENSVIEFSVAPKTQQMNTFVIVENTFILNVGDGDRRAVSLKKMDEDNIWRNWRPDGLPERAQDRVYLSQDIPLEHAVKGKIYIEAKPTAGGLHEVRVFLSFYDRDGKKVETKSAGPEMQWTFTMQQSFNGKKRIGIGLSDPTLNALPKVRFDNLKVSTTDKQ